MANVRGSTALVADHHVSNRYALDRLLRRVVRRDRLDEAFLLVRTNGDDDLVGRLARDGLGRVPRKLASRLRGDSLRLTERLLVVREPIEEPLPNDRNHDLHRVGLSDVRAQDLFGVRYGGHVEYVLGHETRDLPPRAVAVAQASLCCRPRDGPDLTAEPQERDVAQTEHRDTCARG